MNNNIIRKTVHFLQKTYEYQKNSNVDGAQIITFYGGEPLLNFAGIKTFIEEVNKLKVDWAPTILTEHGIDIKSAGWAYFAYEFAAIPGTLICGWLSDRLFNGRRALPTIIFMALVAGFICLYWLFIDNLSVVTVSLIGIGFFIYGPVMLIGVQALDLAPKNAAGTAAGLTGFFGYFFGTAILANTLIGYVSDHFGWNMTFVLLLAACLLSIVFMAVTYKEEQYLAERNKSHQS